MTQPSGRRVNLVVECACGSVMRGEENHVIQAMQVHTRLGKVVLPVSAG